MNFDYMILYDKQLKKNMREVAKNLAKNNNALMKNIRKWAKKHGFKYKAFLAKVRKDKTWQAVFATDPAKQNIFGESAAEFVKNMPNVSNFEQPKPFIYINNGNLTDTKGNSRPISFSWIWTCPKSSESYTCYAYCKYTREEGGSQNNSLDTVENFITDCIDPSGSVNSSIYFFAICDGDYYTSSRISDLKKGAPKNLVVCSTKELYEFLK